MFGLGTSKLPITLDQREWVDQSLIRLANLLGKDRLLKGTLVLPNSEYFPDHYDKSEEALHLIFSRVALYMQVQPGEIEVTLYETTESTTRGLVPFYSGNGNGPGGVYHHDPASTPHISVNEDQLKDPMSLVAVLAHEIGHIILLRPGLVDRDESDMEPLTDLLTVFLGFGIFNSNAAFRFKQFTNNDSQGWSTQRLGYLSEELFGYALARYALERGEHKPAWRSFLATNVTAYMKRSSAWLAENNVQRLFS